jgi:hypothetical protein
MQRTYSPKLLSDVRSAVIEAAASGGTVNVTHLAEMIRLQNLVENVAREDVEWLVVRHAENIGAAMAFSSEPLDMGSGSSMNGSCSN